MVRVAVVDTRLVPQQSLERGIDGAIDEAALCATRPRRNWPTSGAGSGPRATRWSGSSNGLRPTIRAGSVAYLQCGGGRLSLPLARSSTGRACRAWFTVARAAAQTLFVEPLALVVGRERAAGVAGRRGRRGGADPARAVTTGRPARAGAVICLGRGRRARPARSPNAGLLPGSTAGGRSRLADGRLELVKARHPLLATSEGERGAARYAVPG